MINRYWVISALLLLALPQACAHPGLRQELRRSVPTAENAPQILAVYEPWFGHPRHISVGYSSHDPAVIRKQSDQAKALGISPRVRLCWAKPGEESRGLRASANAGPGARLRRRP